MTSKAITISRPPILSELPDSKKCLENGDPQFLNLPSEKPSFKIDLSRARWGHRLEFILSCIGYAVGIGDLTRFPYQVMLNGGGAFLIPYFIMLLACGLPLFLLEVAVGQAAAVTPLTLWDICPPLKGIGWGMIIVSGICCMYYIMMLVYSFYYLIYCFTDPLPWKTCEGSGFVSNCRDGPINLINMTLNGTLPVSIGTNSSNSTYISPAESFWLHGALQISNGIWDLDGVRLPLLGCLVGCWVLVFLCLLRGVRTVGRVVWFTVLAPYVFLLVILVRGVFLDGAIDGIYYFVFPRVEKLLDLKIWVLAAMQVFYSLGPGWGGLITMASYNKYRNDCVRDTVLITLFDAGTSILGGIAIFAVIGHLARSVGTSVEKVVQAGAGPGLAFIAYPAAISSLPLSQVWGILFFLMMITLGIDSEFGMLETLVSGFADEFPRTIGRFRTYFTAACSFVLCAIGFIFVTKAGFYWFYLVEWYAAAFSVVVFGVIECIVIVWAYGPKSLAKDISEMTGRKLGIYWLICWAFITPAILLIVLGGSIASYSVPSYNNQEYPALAILLGWGLAMCSLVPIPLLLCLVLWRHFAHFVPDPPSLEQEASAACCPPGIGPLYALWLRMRPYARHLLHAFRPRKEWRERIEQRRRDLNPREQISSDSSQQDAVAAAATASATRGDGELESETGAHKFSTASVAAGDASHQPLVALVSGLMSIGPSLPATCNASNTSTQNKEQQQNKDHINGNTLHASDANGDLELIALSAADR